MDFRRIVLASLMIFILLAPVCANENLNDSTLITFEGVDFLIPLGFNESKESQDFNDLGSHSDSCPLSQ